MTSTAPLWLSKLFRGCGRSLPEVIGAAWSPTSQVLERKSVHFTEEAIQQPGQASENNAEMNYGKRPVQFFRNHHLR